MSGKASLTFLVVLFYFLAFTNGAEEKEKALDKGLLVITVATDHTDGFSRFMNSIKKHDLKVKVLGMGQKWEGGDIQRFAGGGQKVNLLKGAMRDLKDKKDLLVMFVDSYDLIITADEEEIVNTFKKFNSRVVFSAEGFCWPDPSLADQYPTVKMNEKRYLNSGGFIGYAPDIEEIVSQSKLASTDDDQLFYTQLFLDPKFREKLSMKLDTRGEIFQNLNGALEDVRVKFKGSNSFLYNMKTGNVPLVVHGNGPIKHHFNGITNYLGDHWTPTGGCQGCKQNTISLQGLQEEDYPQVFVAIFIKEPTVFLQEFFENIAKLSYPKAKMDLFLHYSDESSKAAVTDFMDSHGLAYNSALLQTPESKLNDWTARNRALEECANKKSQYFFAVDAEAHIQDPDTLIELIQYNRSVVAPLLVRPGKLWSNFWGGLSSEGYYKRSDDYGDIVANKKRGQWNVPYMSQAFLVQGYRVPSLLGGYINGDLDADMAICKRMRDLGIFMVVDNQKDYGILVNSENYNEGRAHPELYSIFDNRQLWEKKYLHHDYYKTLNDVPFSSIEQPCPDVFWMPFATPTFCRHLIEEMEHFGEWSGGGHVPAKDERLGGGYENVPTVDIHTNQIDWEPQWLEILKSYVGPYSAKVFEGYYTEAEALLNFVVRYKPDEQSYLQPHDDVSTFTMNIALNEPGLDYEARASMNFCVRYKPGEQDRLRPHSDTSTYTINIALNEPGKEYEGGGTRFLRYNCSVTKSRLGWLLMHPGRLTHHHEGLRTTAGTRYIMVSFVDP